MFKFIVVAALLSATAVLARCPNDCSGHGSCSSHDKCQCWANWDGADCSLRKCAYGNAWATFEHDTDPHYYAECSNKGLCDRTSGLCKCFEGYTGRACERSVCPNDCSGHGKCRMVKELSEVGTYTDWDAEKIQACVCDGGWMGPDCASRICPMGDDPLSECDEDDDARKDDVQIQKLTFSHASGDLTSLNFKAALWFTDPQGELWKTDAFELTGTGSTDATNIKTALEGLPNFKIPEVDVSNEVHSSTSLEYFITFKHPENSGNQTLLACDTPLGCSYSGCRPKYDRPTIVLPGAAYTQTSWVGQPSLPNNRNSLFVVFAHTTTTAGTVQLCTTNTCASPSDVIETQEYGTAATESVEFVTLTGGAQLQLTNTESGYFELSAVSCSVSVEQSADDHMEGKECSGRGRCDRAQGVCKCFDGFYGNACESQTILV